MKPNISPRQLILFSKIWIGGILALSILLLFSKFNANHHGVRRHTGFGYWHICGVAVWVVDQCDFACGLAFAVGMVVDASIVSLENIFGYDKGLILLMPPIMVRGKCGLYFRVGPHNGHCFCACIDA